MTGRQQRPRGELDDTQRKTLRQIGEGLKSVYAECAELSELPDDIAEAMKRLGE